MAVTLHTDLTRLTTEELGYLYLFFQCAPRGKVKNRCAMLKRVKSERKRRRKAREAQQ